MSEESKDTDEKKFRLNCKKLFLTYPQSGDTTLVDVKAHLETILDIGGGCMAIELHEDGNKHIHVYLRLNRKCDIRSSSKLDVNDCHGNYQCAKKPSDCYKYINKDPIDYHEWGDIDLGDAVKREIEECNNPHEVMLCVIRHNKIHQHSFWSKYWMSHKEINKEVGQIHPLDSFNIPEGVNSWMEDCENKTLILVGPAGTGKTSLARAVGESLGGFFWATDKNSLLHYNDEKLIIFDDVQTGSCARGTLISLLDIEQGQHIRVLYGVCSVAPGTRRIICTNNLEFIFGAYVDDGAIRRRCKIVWVENSIRRGESDLTRHEELPAVCLLPATRGAISNRK